MTTEGAKDKEEGLGRRRRCEEVEEEEGRREGGRRDKG